MPRKGGEKISPVVEPILPGFSDAMHRKARFMRPGEVKRFDVPTVELNEKKVNPIEKAEQEKRRNHPLNQKRAKELGITVDQLFHIMSLGEKADHVFYLLEHDVPYNKAIEDAQTLVLLGKK